MSHFTKIFAASSTWRSKRVLFTAQKQRYEGILENVRSYSMIGAHSDQRQVELAIFEVKVDVVKKNEPWEPDNSRLQLQCDFESQGAKLEMTPAGNLLFKSGSITGVLLLGGTEELVGHDPTELDHREPGTQHL